jgi:hypothetical protein
MIGTKTNKRRYIPYVIVKKTVITPTKNEKELKILASKRLTGGLGTYAGAAVGIAGDPSAVDGEHHEEHEDCHHDDAAQVHPQPVTAASRLYSSDRKLSLHLPESVNIY